MNKAQLQSRFVDFGARCVHAAMALPKSEIGRHVALQFARSATSCGANYFEACGAESRRDFLHKLQIVLKESRESDYWLGLIARCELIKSARLAEIHSENHELIAICVAAVNTAKRNAAAPGNRKLQVSNQ